MIGSEPHPSQSNSTLSTLKSSWPLLLVLIIWGLQVAGSWLWLKANATPLMGWDAVGHLWRTVLYRDILAQLSPVTLFQAFALDSFRPPLFHLCAVVMYRLFGTTADVAVATSFPFLLLLLLAVYGIGRRLGSPLTGVLATFLVSTFPLAFGLSRAFYVDLALTAWVAAGLFLLLGVDEFRARGYSALLGLCMGLGLLTKWAYPVFVGPALLYAIFSAPSLYKDVQQHLKSLQVQWRRLALSLLGGLLFCLVWCLPNRVAIVQQPLGAGLIVLWGVLVTWLIYSLSSPSGPLANLSTAFSIAAFIASLWYATNSDFWVQVYQRSYGGMGGSLLGEQRSPLLFTLSTLDYIPRRLARSDLSWPYVLLLLFALGSLLYERWRKRTATGPTFALWIVTLWWAVPLVIFTLSINREERSLLPLLPAFGLVIALSLTRPPIGWGKATLIGGAIVFGLVQWFALSYNGLAGISERLERPLPLLGPVGPLATGEYVRWPDWGWTDHRYGIASGILSQISQDSAKRQMERPILGLLVRISQLHGDVFRYLAQSRGMNLEIWDFGESEEGLATYPRLFLCDYLAVPSGPNDFLNPEASPVTEVLNRRPPAGFAQAFAPLAKYSLPDGSFVALYEKASRDALPDMPAEMNLAQHQVDIPFGKQLKLIGYDLSDGAKSGGSFDVTLHWQVLKTPKEDYITSLKLVNAAYRVWAEARGLAAGQWALTSSWPRGQVIKDRRQLIILPGTPPGEYQLEIALFDPYRNRALEPAGSTDAHLGPIRVQRAYPNSRELAIEHRTDSVLADKIRLLGYNLAGDQRPGLPVHLILFWQAQIAPGRPYTVFTHVLDGNSKVWAGKDNEPVDGFYPTTQWTPGEIVRDPYDIPLPTDLAPGEYRLSVGMYDPTTQERLPVPGAENGEILLGPVLVSP